MEREGWGWRGNIYFQCKKLLVQIWPDVRYWSGFCRRVRYRHPLFRLSIRLSTFMLTFDIYVKVSILINYKTKQPSNLVWNISLTSWLCDIGIRLSVCLSVCPSVCLSTFMLKLDIYVRVSVLINYKTKQPSNLAWNISLTSWLCDIGARFSVRLSIRSSVCLLTVLLCRSSTFMSKLVIWSTTRLNNNQTLHETSLWPPDFATQASAFLFVCPFVSLSVCQHLCQS